MLAGGYECFGSQCEGLGFEQSIVPDDAFKSVQDEGSGMLHVGREGREGSGAPPPASNSGVEDVREN